MYVYNAFIMTFGTSIIGFRTAPTYTQGTNAGSAKVNIDAYIHGPRCRIKPACIGVVFNQPDACIYHPRLTARAYSGKSTVSKYAYSGRSNMFLAIRADLYTCYRTYRGRVPYLNTRTVAGVTCTLIYSVTCMYIYTHATI